VSSDETTREPPRWAVVTGASSGIGAEFARQLAARGMHLVLTARRKDRLEQLAAELQQQHGTQILVVAIDLAQPGAAGDLWQAVKTAEIEPDLLVNNAGFSVVSELPDASPDRLLEMVRVNVETPTELTYLALQGMLRRQRGAVINVSSVLAFQPIAFMGVYAASKAYLLHMSESLWAECREQGVHVMALCPGTTETELFHRAGIGGWLEKRRSMTPPQVVSAALRCLDQRKPVCVPGWRNRLMTFLVRLLPRKTLVIGSMNYFHPAATRDSRG
jgi:uncharacterized protein